jgi:hypothetical protein
MHIPEKLFIRFRNQDGSRFYLDGTFFTLKKPSPDIPLESFCCAEFIDKTEDTIIANFQGQRIQIKVV